METKDSYIFVAYGDSITKEIIYNHKKNSIGQYNALIVTNFLLSVLIINR